MRLDDTKKLIRLYENQNTLGADQALSLMMVFMKEVQSETGNRVSELDLVSEPGNERALLDSLNAIAIETSNVMKKINPDEMEAFQKYSKRVCEKSEGMKQVADTVDQWKQIEASCSNIQAEIEAEEKKLLQKKEQFKHLAEEKAKIEAQVADACMTEEECRAAITQLRARLENIPMSEDFQELKKELSGVKEHYRIIDEIVSAFIEDHTEETRLEMKFELSEKKCKEYLQTIAEKLDILEGYYSKMLNYVDEQRRIKENEYAGK